MAKRITYILGIILLLGSVYLLGVTKGYYQRINAYNFNLVFQKELGRYEETLPNFGLYETVIDLVKDKYYGQVNWMDVLYGSTKGAINALGDPYTFFSTPLENLEFFTDLDGIYEGIGIEIDFIDGKMLIVTPIEGSPADLAGLKPRDEIIAIDGRLVEGLDLYEVTDLIKGKSGTQIVLTIKLETNNQIQDFIITREIVRIKSVEVDIRDDVAVLRITKFGSDTEKLFNRAVDQILRSDVKGIVFDLRNNPGGFLDVGVQVANEFLDGGLIVEERFKNGDIIPFTADGDGRLSQMDVIILVNGGSASAAEIVASALRDNNRALIIGQRTYGKGSVQEVEEFSDGSALRITIAHWFTPLGEPIGGEGIKPDILVKDNEGLDDLQLDRAIQELKSLMDNHEDNS